MDHASNAYPGRGVPPYRSCLKIESDLAGGPNFTSIGAGNAIHAGEHMIRQAVDAEDVRAAIITCARLDDFCLDVRKNQDDWPLEVWMTEANLDDDVYLGTYNFDPILGNDVDSQATAIYSNSRIIYEEWLGIDPATLKLENGKVFSGKTWWDAFR